MNALKAYSNEHPGRMPQWVTSLWDDLHAYAHQLESGEHQSFVIDLVTKIYKTYLFAHPDTHHPQRTLFDEIKERDDAKHDPNDDIYVRYQNKMNDIYDTWIKTDNLGFGGQGLVLSGGITAELRKLHNAHWRGDAVPPAQRGPLLNPKVIWQPAETDAAEAMMDAIWNDYATKPTIEESHLHHWLTTGGGQQYAEWHRNHPNLPFLQTHGGNPARKTFQPRRDQSASANQPYFNHVDYYLFGADKNFNSLVICFLKNKI